MRIQTPRSTLFVALFAISALVSTVLELEGSAWAQQLQGNNAPPIPKIGGPLVPARAGTPPRTARNAALHALLSQPASLPSANSGHVREPNTAASALTTKPVASASASTKGVPAPKPAAQKPPSPAKPGWHAPVAPTPAGPMAHAAMAHAAMAHAAMSQAPPSLRPPPAPPAAELSDAPVAALDPAVFPHDDLDRKTAEIDTGWSAKTAEDERTTAMHYGQLGRDECIAEAQSRAIPFAVVDSARGVLAPLRLTGPLHGINIHSPIPANQRATSVYEIMDCRLVLALDDLAQLLKPHDITEIVHMSVYRPPSKGFPDGKQGTRHEGALALDLGHFEKRDGTKLVVEQDYHGFIGQKPCGAGTGPMVRTPASIELRQMACEMLEKKLFSVFLTPGFNAAHHNHFHIEVSANSRGFYVR